MFAHILFIVLILIIYLYNNIFVGDWSALSILLFYIGTLLSLNKQDAIRGILLPMLFTGVIGMWTIVLDWKL